MKRASLAHIVSLAVTLSASVNTFAAPSCTDWMLQPDGTYFRTCIGDDGKQYCEQTKDKRVINRVSCK